MKQNETHKFDVETAYIFSAILGIVVSFILPPIYPFVISTFILLAIKNKKGINDSFVGALIRGFSFTTLLTTVLVVFLVLSGGVKGYFTSEFGNYKVNLNNLPLTYILTGTR